MAKKNKFGELPPRYSFILNPHKGTRLSKCPRCNHLTYPRKFAFLIFIDKLGLMTLGKTCKYCSRCELIMMHQDELESDMAYAMEKKAPEVIGNKYKVLGTFDKKLWQKGLRGEVIDTQNITKHTADFKKEYGLDFQPAGWYFEGK